jgi:hypothetical protein
MKHIFGIKVDPGFESQQGKEILSSKTAQIDSVTHLASYPIGTRVPSQGQSGRGVKLTTYLHIVPRLRMTGAIPLLPLYAFMAWLRTTLPVLKY